MLLNGNPPCLPIPQLRSMYCVVGLVTASTSELRTKVSSLKNTRNSSCVTSFSPIQNAESSIFFCGPSSAPLPFSSGELPIINDPAGTGTILKLTSDPGTIVVYALNSFGCCAKAVVVPKARAIKVYFIFTFLFPRFLRFFHQPHLQE